MVVGGPCVTEFRGVRTVRRLILHAGLPKTATSTIQRWAYDNRAWLQARGLSYPEDVHSTETPKHQWLVRALMVGDVSGIEALAAADHSPALFLSTEGLTNHFEDFNPDALDRFRSLFADCETTLVLTARDKQRWLKSYYWQCAVNPSVPGMPYATGLAFEAFIGLDRVRRLARLPDQPEGLQRAFAAANVEVIRLEDDWQSQLLKTLGLEGAGEPPPFLHHNATIEAGGLEMVLAINRAGHEPAVRETLLALLAKVAGGNHTILRSYRIHDLFLPLCQDQLLRWAENLPAAQASLAGRMLTIAR